VVLKVEDGKVLLGDETGTLPAARKTDPLTASSSMTAWATVVETAINLLAPGTFNPANQFSGILLANPGKAGNFGEIEDGSSKVEAA
jgi:hypothetical protein